MNSAGRPAGANLFQALSETFGFAQYLPQNQFFSQRADFFKVGTRIVQRSAVRGIPAGCPPAAPGERRPRERARRVLPQIPPSPPRGDSPRISARGRDQPRPQTLLPRAARPPAPSHHRATAGNRSPDRRLPARPTCRAPRSRATLAGLRTLARGGRRQSLPVATLARSRTGTSSWGGWTKCTGRR
jgi:hypothetical protein